MPKDHARKGRRLIPPFLHGLGERYKPYSWARQIVPEVFWIGLLIDFYGLASAVKISTDLLVAAEETFLDRNTTPLLALFSSYTELSQEQQRIILNKIDRETLYKLSSLATVIRHVLGENNFDFICVETEHNADDKVFNIDDVSRVLADLNDRNSRISVLSVATSVYLGMRQGKILHGPELFEKRMKDFQAVVSYPRTEDSKMAAGAFRASAPMLLMRHTDQGELRESPWVEAFWSKIVAFGGCDPVWEPVDESTDEAQDLAKIVLGYRNRARRDLKFRLDNWPLNLNHLEQYEVITALLARQVTLAIELAGSPGMWTAHIAPIILRAVADVYITLSWIIKDPDNRSKTFIEDGLGSMKLENAHRKVALEEMEEGEQREELQALHDYWDGWLKSQRIPQLLGVNLGSWSGLTVRKMAEEAECVDFYNHVYQPFSAAVHSNWTHVSEKNTVECQNPTHRQHRTAAVIDLDPDPFWMYLGGNSQAVGYGAQARMI